MKKNELKEALKRIDRDALEADVKRFLMYYDKTACGYEIDLYLYLDDTRPEGYYVDEFTNVGGNSWLNDDHYTLTRKTDCLEWWDYINDIDELAYALGAPLEDIIEGCAMYFDKDPEDISLSDAREWIESEDLSNWQDCLESYAAGIIEENEGYYNDAAADIVAEFFDDMEAECEVMNDE